MNINEAGIKLISEFEGCALTAYQDIKGIWSIGFGHTANVKQGDTCTAEQAQEWLTQDTQWAVERLNRMIKVSLNENQFSACVCFAYNVGTGNFERSTLLRCINTSHLDDAANEFLKWNRANGIVSSGLTRRREQERALFLAPMSNSGQNEAIKST